jgi:hypothetical protein
MAFIAKESQLVSLVNYFENLHCCLLGFSASFCGRNCTSKFHGLVASIFMGLRQPFPMKLW